MGVGNQLLHDRVEPVLVRAPPGRDGGVRVGRDDHLFAERERELLPLDRLDEQRRLQAGGANRLLVSSEHGGRRMNACSGAFRRQPLLAAQPQDDLRVVGQRHVRELVDCVPVPQDEGNVLVALRKEHGALRQIAQELEHVLVRAHQPLALEIARAKAELLPVERDPVDGHAVAAERARQRETGV